MSYSFFARKTLLFAATASAVIAGAACNDNVEIAAQSSSGVGGAASSASTSGPGSGSGGDATTTTTTTGVGGGSPSINSPAGHFMQPWIGDCINGEEWLSFDASPAFTHTFVDRDFCGPHSVTKAPGLFSSDGHTFEVKWDEPSFANIRRHTYALIDQYAISGWPPVDGYKPGPTALNRMAYYRPSDAPAWHREDHRRSESLMNGDIYDALVTIDITLDTPLKPIQIPEHCEMTIAMNIQVTLNKGPTDVANEVFKLQCTYSPKNAIQWITLWADGFENADADLSWSTYLDMMGVWKKYPSTVNNVLYESFRPILFYPPWDDTVLFHDMPGAWYQEMKTPPPDMVD